MAVKRQRAPRRLLFSAPDQMFRGPAPMAAITATPLDPIHERIPLGLRRKLPCRLE
jgi:hypothetical protein